MKKLQGRWHLGREEKPLEVDFTCRHRPCEDHCPRRRRAGIDLRQSALALALWLGLAGAAGAAEPDIRVENEAAVPAAELDSILRDFRQWGARVYRYHGLANPAPVALRLTRKVRFGFYRGGTVLLPPSADRWEMLDNWVHELTHHATGHDSSFFFKEGMAVHTLEALFAEAGRVPATWPQFGQRTDAWVRLYAARGQLLPIAEALAWPRYRGDTPEDDFRSWQIYNVAGSFVGWYRRTYGAAALRQAFANEWPEQDSGELERAWLAEVRRKSPDVIDAAAVLPMKSRRYRNYAERLK
jgi:hypothetical protein